MGVLSAGAGSEPWGFYRLARGVSHGCLSGWRGEKICLIIYDDNTNQKSLA